MDTTILCDAKCWSEFALPANASTSVTSDKIILSEGKLGAAGIVDYLGELVVIVPALTATICPNGKTVTVQVETSNDDFTNIKETVTLATLTGSSGVAKTVLRYKFRRDAANKARVKITFGAECTDGSALKALALWEM